MTDFKDAVFVVAAEESSCKYALRIIKGLKKQKNLSPLKFWGIGNKELEEAGLERIARSEDIAVMGLFEIFKVRKKIKSALQEILKRVDENPPSVALLLDFGGFNLYLAAKLKARGIPVIYYVLPKVWAWRQKRALKIKKNVDEALAIHPFEEDFFKKFEVQAQFVGHPLLEEKQDFLNSSFNKENYKKNMGFKAGAKILGLMPGSRNSEMKRHMEPMLGAAQKLLKKNPELEVAVLVAPGFDFKDLQNQFSARFDFPLHFLQTNSWEMIEVCDYVLTASGTATLQVGLLRKPQVVLYKMNALSARLAKTFVRGIEHFSLVNLILEKPAVTELFQNEVTPERLSNELQSLIEDSNKLETLLKNYQDLEIKMQSKNATEQVVEVLKKYLRPKLSLQGN